MSVVNINSISGINSITDQGGSGVTFYNNAGTLTNISASSISASSVSSSGNVSASGNVLATGSVSASANVSASSSITAAQYNFSTQGFNFELKDGLLTPTNKTKYTFAYSGANQTFTVPGGVNWIYVKLWGAGGGAGRAGGWNYGADGGGGGHVRGLFPVTPASTIIVVVGRGGVLTNSTNQSYGGGGTSTAVGGGYGGQGGGYCGVFVTSVSQANALAIAGGGGGGGCSRLWFGNVGGAGGGLVGQRGASPYDGKFTAGGNPGTQSAGGAATSGYTNNGSAGSALQGGTTASLDYSGAGGGGYFGGGGGGYSETNTMAGGGGGSGFVKSTGLLLGTYTGNYRMVAIPEDPDLLTTTTDIALPGFGGQNTQNNQAAGAQSGGHAYAVIYY
jgi:hypothetical protein